MGIPDTPTAYPDGPPTGEWTLAEYWAWDQVSFAERHLRRSTLAQYKTAWLYWWGERLGGVRLCDLTMDQIQTTLDETLEERKVVPSTAKSNVSVLSAVLGRARLNRAIDRNPAERVRGPRMIPTKPTALTADELGLWLDAVLLPSGVGGFLWAGAMLAFAPVTGLRFGELRGLRWSNVELWDRPEGETAGTIHVVEQIDSGTRHTNWGPPKSAASYRHVPIPRFMVGVLDAQRERVKRQALRKGTRGWHEHGLVFPSRNGYALSGVTVFDARRRAAEMAGLDPIPTFNCLRHTYASRLVEGGMSPAQVAKLLGHHDEMLVVACYFDASPITHDAATAAVTAAIPKRTSYRGG